MSEQKYSGTDSIWIFEQISVFYVMSRANCVIMCMNRNTELDCVRAVTVITMPTVLLLDVSLSMNRTVPGTALSSPVADANTYRHLAIRGIHSMLDYLAANNKLEFVSLVF